MRRKGLGYRFALVGLCLIAFVSMNAWAGGQADQGAAPAAAAPAAKPTKFNEAPMLADMVKKGQIPSVDQRLPEDVLVVKPIEKVGKYVGTAYGFATDPNMWQDLQRGAGMADGLFKMTKEGTNIEPNLAKDYQLASDYKSFTFFLRKGAKWSDGQPITADDSLFWFNDMVRGPAGIATWSPLPGDFTNATKIDDFTVRLNFSAPYPAIIATLSQWASWNMIQPKHFLSKWHIKYNPDAEKLAKEEKFDTWQLAFQSHYWWAPQKELRLPKIDPWLLKETTTTNLIFERNPYYWKVDTAGNQLPYIDKLQLSIVDVETYNLKVIAGEADYAYTQTDFQNFTLYKENEAKGNYRTILMPGGKGSEITVALNLNYPDAAIRKVFQDAKFRQALSLAINRKEINDVIFLGKGVPRQATVLPTVSYYKQEWGNAFASYDVARANKLLDEAGLNKKDRDGFRTLPDGKQLQVVVEYSGTDAETKALELIKEYWDAVGINTMVRFLNADAYHEREGNYEHMARVIATGFSDEISNYSQGSRIYASQGDIITFANIWNRWDTANFNVANLKAQIAAATVEADKAKFQDNLKTQQEALDAATKLCKEVLGQDKPPAEYLQLNQWFRDRANYALGSKEYKEISQKIFDFHAANVWLIGTVGMAPKPLIAKNRLRNVITPAYIDRAVLPFDTTGYFYQMYLE